MLRNTFVILSAGVASAALLVAAGLGGCQSSNSGTSTGVGSGGGGTGGSNSTTSAGGAGTTTGGDVGGATSTGSQTTTSTTGAGGGGPSCAGQDATIQDITSGTIGPKVKVKVTGVVAMSHKFLVSKSKSGSCLWGVYVSAPGIAETAPNTGVLAVSYGTNAQIPDGGNTAFCPILGEEPAGDKIPDDTKPGDVLDLVGETDYFLLPQCANEPNGSTVPQRQIAKVCSATKTGTAPLPKAHVLAANDIAKLADPNDTAFHDQWGGVKVQVNNVTAVPQDPGDGGAPSIVGQYGIITLQQGNLEVGDNVYYVGALKKQVCYAGPQFSSPDFNSIAGFSTINFCTWSLEPNDKCSDFNPPSEDCNGMTCQ